MKNIKVKAPAKINLTLEIIKRLSNGFHDLRTIILKFDSLYDEINIKIDPEKEGIKIASSSNGIPLDEENICHKVAKGYLDKIGEKARIEIFINKKIPSGAGLGGGSSNGASVLLALNRYYGNRLELSELIRISEKIGKDIPVFLIKEKAVFVSGMGEKLDPICKFPKLHFLIINPLVHSSTKKAFEMATKELWFMENKKRTNISQKMYEALKMGDKERILNELYNDFEFVLEKAFPIIKEIKHSLLALGAKGVLMSGAGSSVFGVFPSQKSAQAVKKLMEEQYPKFFTCLC